MAEERRIPVLFLLMEFPPVNTTGNFRALKFIKYLSEFGIDPIVVTFKETEAAEYFQAKLDWELLKEIPLQTSIYRIHCRNAGSAYKNHLRTFFTIFFSIKDSFAKRWRPHLLGILDKVIYKHKPRLIFTSLPPFSSGMLAVEVAARYRLPLVVDMRDLWAMWGNRPYGTRLHYWLTVLEERRIFRNAAAVVGVTPQLVQTFRKSHPLVLPSKFKYLSNGFDSEISLSDSFTFPARKKRVTIGYVGSFYYDPKQRQDSVKPWWKRRGHRMLQYVPVKEDWLYRSPYFFLKTLAELFKKSSYFRQVISIEFVGKKPSWLDGMVEEFGLSEHIISHGFLPQAKVLEIQKGFDLVLATSEKVHNGEHYCLPSKTFDYIGLGKPILGFVTDGIQRDFIIRSGLGIICDPDNLNASINEIEQLLNGGKTFYPNREYIDSFHRKRLTAELSKVLKESAAK